MSGPFFSVVIVTYNTAPLLERAVASVLAQTFPDFELIVVDDCSTDDTSARMASRSDLTYIRLEANVGASVTRNIGIARARGEWIAFLDGDDVWRPDKLERQRRVALDPRMQGVQLIFSDYETIDVTGEPMPGMTRQGFPIFTELGLDIADLFRRRVQIDDMVCWRELDPVHLFLGNFILPSAAIMRRAMFAHWGDFDARYWTAHDTDLFLRWGSRGDFAFIDRPLLDYTRGRPGQITSPVNYIQAVETDLLLRRRFLERNPEFEQLHPEVVHQVFAGQYALMGRLQLVQGEYAKARAALDEAWRYGPLSLKSAIVYGLTRLPLALLPAAIGLACGAQKIRRKVALGHASAGTRPTPPAAAPVAAPVAPAAPVAALAPHGASAGSSGPAPQ